MKHFTKHSIKKTRRAPLVALCAIPAALACVGLFVAWRLSDVAAIDRALAKQASSLGLSLAVERIQTRLLPLPSVELRGVLVSGPSVQGAPAAKMAGADAIVARPALWPLLMGRFELKSVDIGSAILFFDQPASRSLWNSMLKAAPAQAGNRSDSLSAALPPGSAFARLVELRLPGANVQVFSMGSLAWDSQTVALRANAMDSANSAAPFQIVAERQANGWGLRTSAAGQGWQARAVVDPSPHGWLTDAKGSLSIQASDAAEFGRSWLPGAGLSGPINIAAPFSLSGQTASIFPIDANIGAWRAKGAMRVDFSLPRPLAKADLALSRVPLEGLSQDKGKAGIADASSSAALPWGLLASIDAELRLSADKLSWDGFSATEAGASFSARNGVLSGPFFAKIPGGKASGSARLDSSDKGAELSLYAESQAQALLEARGVRGAVSGGSFSMAARLSAHGDSQADLLATASGPVMVDMERVAIASSKAAAASKILGAIIPALGGSDGSVVFECAAAKWSFSNGKAEGSPLAAAESPYFALLSKGIIDARDQTLNISFEARPKGAFSVGNLGALSSAARVKGSWSDPGINVDALAAARGLGLIGAAISAGGSAALGQVLSPPPPEANVCGALLGRPMPPVAPPAIHPPAPFQKSVDTFRQIFKR